MNSTTIPPSQCHVLRDTFTGPREAVIELCVRNHPGTMSHITGLFARRGFNLDAILCVPVGDGATSRILLLVSDEPRLDQVERQLARLHDVLSLRHRPELGGDYFARLVPDGGVIAPGADKTKLHSVTDPYPDGAVLPPAQQRC